MPTELTNQDLNREEQLTLSLDMKVKEIEQLKQECESRRAEVLDCEKRYESTINRLEKELSHARNTSAELRIEIKEIKAKLSQANDTIEAFIDKLT